MLNAYLRVLRTPVIFISPTDQSLTRHEYPQIRSGHRAMYGVLIEFSTSAERIEGGIASV
jgi:hypothetical protein